MRLYQPTRRDKIIWRVCNFILQFATEDYRLIVGNAIEYGLRSAARDEREGLPVPPPLEYLESL
jgi:hypothetical protein